MGMIMIGDLDAASDITTASNVRTAGTQTRAAVEARVAPAVAQAIADDDTVVNAAAAAVNNEVVSRNLIEGGVSVGNLAESLQTGVLIDELDPASLDAADGYYIVSGGVVTTASSSSWSRGHIEVGATNAVKVGDTLFLGQPMRGSAHWGTIPVMVIAGASGVLRTVSWGDFPTEVGADGRAAQPMLVKVPRGATDIYFNSKNGWWPVAPAAIAETGFRDLRLDSGMTELGDPLIPELTVENKIYSVANWGFTLAGYRGYAYRVNPGDKLRITGTIPGDAQFNAGFFMGSLGPNGITDGSPLISWVNRWHATNPGAYDIDVIVPSGAHYYVVCNNTGTQTVTPYVLTAPQQESRKPLQVTRSGYMVSALSNTDNGIVFDRFGGNSLVMPRTFITAGHARTIGTDTCPGPYIMTAVSNGDGDRTATTFTGGNHAFNGDETGTATASLDQFAVYVDGTALPDGGAASAEFVELVTVNLVQASNTCLAAGGGRAVLRETVRYRFDGVELRVSVVVEPLEAITISRYYGLQLAGFANANYGVYLRDRIANSPGGFVQGSDLPYAVVGDDSNGSVVMRMERAGLGTYEWNGTTDVAHVSNHKGYFVAIRESKSFTAADKLFLAGSYTLAKIAAL